MTYGRNKGQLSGEFRLKVDGPIPTPNQTLDKLATASAQHLVTLGRTLRLRNSVAPDVATSCSARVICYAIFVNLKPGVTRITLVAFGADGALITFQKKRSDIAINQRVTHRSVPSGALVVVVVRHFVSELLAVPIAVVKSAAGEQPLRRHRHQEAADQLPLTS